MIKEYSKIYKKTVTGATQVWWMEQDGSKYRSNSHQLGSDKIVTTEWTSVSGKNTGKKNETTPEKQAELEIISEYTKKLNQGNYKKNVEDIDKENYFKPMLAKSLEDYPISDFKNNLKKVYSQPKLDGTRLVAMKSGLFSRNGKKYFSIPHIEKHLQPVFELYPDLVLDGELYNHTLKDNFNKIISLVKKTKPSKADLQESEDIIQYWIYDCFLPEQENLSFSERYKFLLDSIIPLFFESHNIRLVKTNLLSSKDEMLELYSKYVEAGFEGQMIRIDGFPYENKRVNHLLKNKSFLDKEFEIISIEEGIGNRSGMAGFIVYKLDENRTFKSSIKASVDQLKDLFINREKYKGCEGTVKYFSLTPDGVPRFPVTIKLYEGKRDV